jgi:hypothetical protein
VTKITQKVTWIIGWRLGNKSTFGSEPNAISYISFKLFVRVKTVSPDLARGMESTVKSWIIFEIFHFLFPLFTRFSNIEKLPEVRYQRLPAKLIG